jgi:hypothetical protein
VEKCGLFASVKRVEAIFPVDSPAAVTAAECYRGVGLEGLGGVEL